MPLPSNLDLFPSTEFGQIARRSKSDALLFGVCVGVVLWVLDSLSDTFFFHDGTLFQELFHPDHRELQNRLVLTFGSAFFTYFYFRLQQTGQQLRIFFEIVENAADSVMLRTLDGRILYTNNTMSKKLGYSREELVKMNLKEIDPNVSDLIIKNTSEILRQNKVLRGEGFHQSKTGELIPVEYLGSFLKIRNLEYAISIVRDVSKQKITEQEMKSSVIKLRNANRLKDLFNDILSHDLMNPASAVRLASELLLKLEADPTKIKMISNIRRSTENIIDLCANASKYAKVTSAEQLELEEHDLNNILRRVIRDLVHLSMEKRIEIHDNLEGEHFASVNLMISDVFSNLISNAIKYSSEGSVVNVDVRDEGETLLVSIGDQGEGIPEKFKDLIFNRFERIGHNGDKGVKGTGLGLAIAKGIVDLHSGKIWAENNADRGSIFFVRLLKKR